MEKDINKMKIVPRIKRILFELEDAGVTTPDGKPITQEWLAQQLEIRPQSVNAWVRGKAFPKGETMFKLAYLLGVKVDDLYKVEWEE